jgi:hypothetical protein
MGAIAALTLCAWIDHSFFISNGFGYFQHPGIWGWYLIQAIMPLAIYSTLKRATRSGKHYSEVTSDRKAFKFRAKVFDPIVSFVGFGTTVSRSIFAFLFLIGFAGFAWNTFQNLSPGTLAPLDFWDSIHFPFGYFGSRLYKFYVDALLLPGIIHIFAGVVWTNMGVVRLLIKQQGLRLSVFNADRSGGFGFLADLILSPTVSALLVSGLAFFGVVYTHQAFDISTVTGILVQAAILLFFYIVPTFCLRSFLVQLKELARRKVHLRQEAYYEGIVSGKLDGTSLKDAHEYLRYFNDISAAIDKIPDWPHLAKVSSVFGISISPALVSSLIGLVNTLMKFYPSRP